jgi:sarcosine oxidase subunit gamma
MAEQRSALESIYRTGQIGVKGHLISTSICECRDRKLVQISGWQDSFKSVCVKLAAVLKSEIPNDLRQAKSFDGRSIFRVGPERLWVVGASNDKIMHQLDSVSLGDEATLTEIGHSRTVLRISGPESDTLLNRGLPIDLDSKIFPVNTFVQSTIHHMSVLVHRIDIAKELVFDIYISRELAITFWEWLTEAAAPLGCEIKQPDRSA